MNQAARPSETSTGKIVFWLGLLAAAHVFIFTAAFPFFSIVDEHMHFDLVVHYSQGDIPRSLAPADPNAIPFFVIFSSLEYMRPPGQTPPPPWKQPMDSVRDRLEATQAEYQQLFRNHESSQPPLYYTMAGAWWRLGKMINLNALVLLYWLRFLNVAFIVAIVWLGWAAARRIFPENNFIQVAVPALIAFLPQSTFYAVNNDILSPLTFGAVFVLVLKFWETEVPGPRLAAATGLALAATFLTKISNLPLLGVAGGFLAVKIFCLLRDDRRRGAWVPLLVLLLCATLPMAAWMIWCRTNYGDLTGSAIKVKFLHWADKPVAQWLHHPLFTVQGFWYFLKTNLATFWQGEQLWWRQPMNLPSVSLAYSVLTLAAFAFTLAALLHPRSAFTPLQRTATAFGFLGFAAMLAFFALLSVKYDFQDCFYPSSAVPFFTSGRLMLGMLIPFMILFAAGLDRMMKNFQAATKYFVLALLLVFMLASEIATDWPVFGSPYNWFHN